MKAQVIILAAGKGSRFNSGLPKQIVKLKGSPVFLWSWKAFASLSFVRKIILVLSSDIFDAVGSKYADLKNTVFAVGGEQRFDSVQAGLKLIDEDADFIAVHDSARPLINPADIKAVFKQAQKTKAAIAAEKTKDTIKVVSEGSIVKTLDRKTLWNAQTPQIFEKSLLLKAYAQKIPPNITDDAQLIERLGIPVSIVETKYPNLKITHPQDLSIAKLIST